MKLVSYHSKLFILKVVSLQLDLVWQTKSYMLYMNICKIKIFFYPELLNYANIIAKNILYQ